MINAARFAVDAEYRAQEFQTTPEDRPLVAHFGGNDPAQLLAAARLVEDRCDAVDLNLGCPQVVAFHGHYGSFLLDDVDRPLVLKIVKTLADALSIPVFVKIRLLSTLPATIELCNQLAEAGAALIAVHARHRVSLTDRNADARGGRALLEQVTAIGMALPMDVTLIACVWTLSRLACSHEGPLQAHLRMATSAALGCRNGNVREHADVAKNMEETGADGIMSAEGLLDNPAIFSPTMHGKDRLELALEYLELAEQHPAPMRCVIFHTRRIAKQALMAYQLMQECCAATTVAELRGVVERCVKYQADGDFVYDGLKVISQQFTLLEQIEERGAVG